MDTLARSMLEAFEDPAAVLDRVGLILAVNAAWAEDPSESLGVDYLRLCDSADGPGAEGAREVADGLRALLNGGALTFEIVYPCHEPNRERWYRLKARQLEHELARVLMVHIEETAKELWRQNFGHRFDMLSKREREVLAWVVRGLSSREIGEKLGIHPTTVVNHRRIIMLKTGANNAAELVRLALAGEVVEAHHEVE